MLNKELLVSSCCTLKEAISIMNRVHKGIVLVVDNKGRFIGLVADSDIRRALICGKDLHQSIETIIRRDPLTITKGTSDSQVVQLLQNPAYIKRAPFLIPIIDRKGRAVDVCEISDLLREKSLNIETGKCASKPNNILIIGGAGYIGSVLVRHLLNSGYYVSVFDRLLYGDASIRDLKTHPRFKCVCGDTRHIEDLFPLINKATAVVHLAELVGDSLCADNPRITFETNYLATCLIVRMCSYLQIRRFIYLSSCSVYGASENPNTILDERSNLNPVSLYAKMKIKCERVILNSMDKNFSPCILRLGTVFGLSYRPRFDLVVNKLVAKAVQDGKIEIFGDKQWRPHISVRDVAEAVRIALESPIGQTSNRIFNIVNTNYTIKNIGKMITRLIPGTGVIRKHIGTDKRSYRVSGEKAKNILGFIPKVNLEDGIKEIVKELKTDGIKDCMNEKYHNLFHSSVENYDNQ